MDPLDLALSPDRIGDAVETVSNNTENSLYPSGGQSSGKLICNGLCHRYAPWFGDITVALIARYWPVPPRKYC
jgi:hypothetical protein